MAVPFQTPTVPGVALAADPTTISLANTKPQRSDSYQPSERGDHSNICTRMGDGSANIALICGAAAKDGSSVINVRASEFSDDSNAAAGIRCDIEEMMVRMV